MLTAGRSQLSTGAGRPSAADELDADRERLIAVLVEFQEAARALEQTLRGRQTAIRTMIRKIERGSGIDGLIVPGPTDRAGFHDLTDRIDDLERTRLRCRCLLVEVGRKQGLSIGEIARRWGLSRQLISRYAK